MQVQLITDGGADLSPHLVEDFNVKVVPLSVQFGDKQLKGNQAIDNSTFYKMMRESAELPQTSAPSPYDFYEVFKETDPELPILAITLSKEISSTYNNAMIGRQMILDEQPDRVIEILNSKNATSGMTLLVHEAAKKIKENMGFEQLIKHMNHCINHTTTLIVLKTLDNIIKGGRLDKVKGAIAKTLNIKLLMKNSEIGTIEVMEKVRGSKKAIRRFIEHIGEHTKNFENKTIVLAHSNDEEKAKSVLNDILHQYPFKEKILAEMGPLIGTHAGEGGLVIAFFRD